MTVDDATAESISGARRKLSTEFVKTLIYPWTFLYNTTKDEGTPMNRGVGSKPTIATNFKKNFGKPITEIRVCMTRQYNVGLITIKAGDESFTAGTGNTACQTQKIDINDCVVSYGADFSLGAVQQFSFKTKSGTWYFLGDGQEPHSK